MKKIYKLIKDSWRKLSEQKPQKTQGNSFRYIEHGCITEEDYEEGDTKKEKKEEDWSWYNV